jgi:inner membrane protein
MDNITHSLLGAALAELTLPGAATRPRRRIFFVSGIIAANLPDGDLLYTRITPPPLGYLLHHRGHTHTVVGLLLQGLLIGAVCLLPAIRRNVGTASARLWTLIALGLLSHLLLDSWNSYGVHPFWPLNVQWYYGDAIYILEPWLWLLLGVAATLNTQTDRGRLLLGAALVGLAGALAWLGMLPSSALAALAVVGTSLGVITRGWTPRRRSGLALALTALFVVAMFGVRQSLRGRVLASMTPASRGAVLDVVLSPQMGNPLCWTALTVVRDEPAGEYVMTRGTAAVVLPSACGSNQQRDLKWGDPVHRSLGRLRELDRTSCPVHAWMQFGRAPDFGERAIGDLRYGGAAHENFSWMPLPEGEQASVCPPHLTHWGLPRADLLGSGSE